MTMMIVWMVHVAIVMAMLGIVVMARAVIVGMLVHWLHFTHLQGNAQLHRA
jgi:hypothetical protein